MRHAPGGQVYFGFSHCPDICPEELDKMATMFDIVEAKAPGSLAPVFITCDPARDDPKILKSYLAEFHPRYRLTSASSCFFKRGCGRASQGRISRSARSRAETTQA